jgi:hypothetical protein
MKSTATLSFTMLFPAVLAGCQLIPPNDRPPTVSPETCGAELIGDRWVGSLPTAEFKAYVDARVGDRPIRYYTVGDPITMDHNPGRLNVVLGKDGRIQRLRCG